MHQIGTQHTNARHWINSNNCGKKRHFARVCRQNESYRRKVQNATEETAAIGEESDESESER